MHAFRKQCRQFRWFGSSAAGRAWFGSRNVEIGCTFTKLHADCPKLVGKRCRIVLSALWNAFLQMQLYLNRQTTHKTGSYNYLYEKGHWKGQGDGCPCRRASVFGRTVDARHGCVYIPAACWDRRSRSCGKAEPYLSDANQRLKTRQLAGSVYVCVCMCVCT